MSAKILNFMGSKGGKAKVSITNCLSKPKPKLRASQENLTSAFYWALSEQKRQGFLAQPLVLNINDEDGVECGDAHVMLFVEPDTNEAAPPGEAPGGGLFTEGP